MLWLLAFVSVVAGYFLVLTAETWLIWKSKLKGEKNILILTLKNCGESLEMILWDLFRLKSWWQYRDFNFMVVDDKSEDDSLLILETLRRKHPFVLVDAAVAKRFLQMKSLRGERVMVVTVIGPESPKQVRKKVITLLNECRTEEEYSAQNYCS